MLLLPSLHLGPLSIAPLALLPIVPVIVLILKPSRIVSLLALVTSVPLLLAPAGAGLVGGVAVCALLLRALLAIEQQTQLAKLALLWLPVALLQAGGVAFVWPVVLIGALAALTASVATAAALEHDLRWPLALLLALLPFAPFGDALLQPAQVSAALPFSQVAARWQFTGPGEIDVAALSGIWFLADRLARGALFLALLLGWAAERRPVWFLDRAAFLLLLFAGGLLAGQTLAAASAPVHAPGFPLAPATALDWNAAGVALALARIASLAVLLRAGPRSVATSLDGWAGLSASLLLAALTYFAPEVVGPTWLVDPLALALLALVLAATVRVRATAGWPRVAAGLVQLAAAAALAGGSWAGWATTSLLQP